MKVKEQDKVMIAKLILKITTIMIIISVIIKLLGFNLFEADYENSILQFLSNFIENFKYIQLRTIINFLLIFLQIFIFYKLSCKNKNTKTTFLFSIILSSLTLLSQYIIFNYFNQNNFLYNILNLSLLVFSAVFLDIKIKYSSKKINVFQAFLNRIKRPFLILLLQLTYQYIALFLRNIMPINKYDTVYNILLNFDYITLLLLTYYIRLKNEYNIKHASLFSLSEIINKFPDKNDINNGIEKIQQFKKEFKKQTKTNKIVFVIYIVFFIIQESLTLGLIIFIANLNNYMIECIFILSSFLISKKVFGAFHFKSFILCFFVSNSCFFILSKLTMEVNVTFVVPIACGILLSYISSKFIKKNNNAPYRGMPEKDLENICKDKKLNKLENDILVDYYCNRYNLEKMAIKYSYSDRSIQRIKFKALKKVEI